MSLGVVTFRCEWLVTESREKCLNPKAAGVISHYCKCHCKSLLQVNPPTPPPPCRPPSFLSLPSFFFHASRPHWSPLIDSLSSVDPSTSAAWVHLCFTFDRILFPFFPLFFSLCHRLVTAFYHVNPSLHLCLSVWAFKSTDRFDKSPPMDVVNT